MKMRILGDPIRIRKAVLSFTGWPDAGKVVQLTLEEMEKSLACEPAAQWNMDGYWHTGSSRPEIVVRHGQIQRFDWPSYRFSICRLPSTEPVLIGTGPEPAMRWESFARELLGQLEQWGCREIIFLGSLYDQISHEETVVSSVVQDILGFNRVREAGCLQIEYDGPAAVHSAIMEAAQEYDIHSVSVWAHFPFYLDGPHEMIMARLLKILGTLLGNRFDTRNLERRWQKREKEIENLVLANHELRHTLDAMRKGPKTATPDDRPSKLLHLDEFIKRRREITHENE